MGYSLVGILAIAINFIINHDLLRLHDVENASAAHKAHRAFLISIMVYFLTDALWGILDLMNIVPLLYADTTVYFAAMAVSVFLWAQYVIAYLERRDLFGRILLYSSVVLVAFELVIILVNIFQPVLFSFKEDGTYVPGIARYVSFGVQIVMFLLAAAYTLSALPKSEDAAKNRNLAIGFFGLAMTVAIAAQLFNPLLPLYAAGYMLGICFLHTFVVEDEKEEQRKKLEELFEQERRHREELGSARRLAYTDSLTGAKSVHAYMEDTRILNQQIDDGEIVEFAVVLFDLNDLKITNDTRGHEMGDKYIITACKLVCDHYVHSPVYRIGGDEFVAILKGADYQNRESIITKFNELIDRNVLAGDVVVASGMADFNPLTDPGYSAVFERADAKMYLRKMTLKNQNSVPAEA